MLTNVKNCSWEQFSSITGLDKKTALSIEKKGVNKVTTLTIEKNDMLQTENNTLSKKTSSKLSWEMFADITGLDKVHRKSICNPTFISETEQTFAQQCAPNSENKRNRTSDDEL